MCLCMCYFGYGGNKPEKRYRHSLFGAYCPRRLKRPFDENRRTSCSETCNPIFGLSENKQKHVSRRLVAFTPSFFREERRRRPTAHRLCKDGSHSLPNIFESFVCDQLVTTRYYARWQPYIALVVLSPDTTRPFLGASCVCCTRKFLWFFQSTSEFIAGQLCSVYLVTSGSICRILYLYGSDGHLCTNHIASTLVPYGSSSSRTRHFTTSNCGLSSSITTSVSFQFGEKRGGF